MDFFYWVSHTWSRDPKQGVTIFHWNWILFVFQKYRTLLFLRVCNSLLCFTDFSQIFTFTLKAENGRHSEQKKTSNDNSNNNNNKKRKEKEKGKIKRKTQPRRPAVAQVCGLGQRGRSALSRSWTLVSRGKQTGPAAVACCLSLACCWSTMNGRESTEIHESRWRRKRERHCRRHCRRVSPRSSNLGTSVP